MNLYKEKETSYFSNIRFDLIKSMPINSGAKVLEIGAGGGDTLLEIKKLGLADEVVGVELFSIPASNQTNPKIDKFIVADVENDILNLPTNYFDVVLIGDVLEHLVDPWKVIDHLSGILTVGGVFVASVPNIRFASAFFKIFIKGDFKYEKHGLFDRTHLRYFCKKNISQLFSTPYLTVQSITSIDKLWDNHKFNFKSFFNKISFNLFEEFTTLQYVVVAKKNIVKI